MPSGWSTPTGPPSPTSSKQIAWIVGLGLAAVLCVAVLIVVGVFVFGKVVDALADDMTGDILEEMESTSPTAPLTPGPSAAPGSTTSAGLSAECKKAIDTNDLENIDACDNDDVADIEEYGRSFEQ